MTNIKVLILEDDRAIAYNLKYILSEDYEVYSSYTVQDAIKKIDQIDFDCYILDVRLPDGDGFEVCKYIRTTSESPLIFLTVEEDEENVVHGLDLGADDYIIKPFRINELKSRIKNVMRRKSSHVLIFNDLKINTRLASGTLHGIDLNISSNEFKLLLHLIQNINKLVERKELYESVWGTTEYINANTLTVSIKRLREKLENSLLIETVHGKGYIINYENSER